MGEEGGRPVTHNSEIVNDNEMKFDGVVENHKIINLAYDVTMTS